MRIRTAKSQDSTFKPTSWGGGGPPGGGGPGGRGGEFFQIRQPEGHRSTPLNLVRLKTDHTSIVIEDDENRCGGRDSGTVDPAPVASEVGR